MTNKSKIETNIIGVDVVPEKYPCLKRFSDENVDFIVLFNGENRGTIIHVIRNGKTAWKVGDFSGSWSEEEFVEFKGKISISCKA